MHFIILLVHISLNKYTLLLVPAPLSVMHKIICTQKTGRFCALHFTAVKFLHTARLKRCISPTLNGRYAQIIWK